VRPLVATGCALIVFAACREDTTSTVIPSPSCDDGNACTDDRFDPSSGDCVHEPRTDCERVETCTSPELVSTLPMIVASVSRVILPGGRIVYLGHGGFGPERPWQRISVVRLHEGELRFEGETNLRDGPYVLGLRAIGRDLVLAQQGDWTVYRVGAAGKLTRVGTADFPDGTNPHTALGLDDHFYVCGPEGLHVFRAEENEVRELSRLALPGCSVAAHIHEPARLLLVVGEKKLTVISLADPARPVVLARHPAVTHALTNGRTVLVRPIGDGRRLVLRSLADWRVESEIRIDRPTIWMELVDDRHLLIGLEGESALRFFDISDPARVVELGEVPLALNSQAWAAGHGLVVLGGEVLVPEAGRAPALWRVRSPPNQGYVSRAFADGSRVWFTGDFHGASVNLLDLSEPETPEWIAGALYIGPIGLIGIGPGGGAPILGVRFGNEGFGIDASNPAEPVIVSRVFFPYETSPRGLAGGPRFFHGVNEGPKPSSVRVSLYDFGKIDPSRPEIPAPDAEAQIETRAVRESAGFSAFLAADGRRVLVAFQHQGFELSDGSGQRPLGELALADLEDRSLTRVTERHVFIPEGFGSFALRGDRVLAVGGGGLHVFAVDGVELRPLGTLPRGGCIIAIHDHEALLAVQQPACCSPSRLAFVDISASPRVLGELRLSAAAQHAVAVGDDHYAIASLSQIDVVRRPCR